MNGRILAAAASALVFSACSSRHPATGIEEPISYPVIHYDSTYKARKNLNPSIALFYPGETPPDNTELIVPSTERGRAGDCETATLMALMALQIDAEEVGANAIINLAASWEGESMMSDDGLAYRCLAASADQDMGIDWSGDFVILEAPP